MIESIAIVAHEDGSILAGRGPARRRRRNAVLGERAGALRVAVTAPAG